MTVSCVGGRRAQVARALTVTVLTQLGVPASAGHATFAVLAAGSDSQPFWSAVRGLLRRHVQLTDDLLDVAIAAGAELLSRSTVDRAAC